MKRKTGVTVSVLFLAVAVSGFAQGFEPNSSPVLPAEILGPQLIVWSQLQQPRPVPQPLPPPDRKVQPPDPQGPETPANGQEQTPAPPQEPAAQTFTGTIMQDGGSYVLKVQGGPTYQIDHQDDAKKYEGKQVKVIANLDTKGTVLHVVSIELIS